jgi:hypothetical protein
MVQTLPQVTREKYGFWKSEPVLRRNDLDATLQRIRSERHISRVYSLPEDGGGEPPRANRHRLYPIAQE